MENTQEAMDNYKNKTNKELLEIIKELEKKVSTLTSRQFVTEEKCTLATEKCTPLSDSKFSYTVDTPKDITDIKKIEKELNAARIKTEESERLKSAFLANMSHEIRTPLNAIVGFSKLICATLNADEQNQYAEILESNSEILLNLFNDIIDLASLEANSLEFNMQSNSLFGICQQLEQVFQCKVQKNVKLALDETDTNTHVLGDLNHITQIISNLLSNAIKFTPKGDIHFGFYKKGDFAECYVKDSGIGIPAERIATIFQHFGKVNYFIQGTGLGLTLCKKLTEKMRGHIWLHSTEGEGTTVYFTLPLTN